MHEIKGNKDYRQMGREGRKRTRKEEIQAHQIWGGRGGKGQERRKFRLTRFGEGGEEKDKKGGNSGSPNSCMLTSIGSCLRLGSPF